jgi:hypothetical protein
VLYGVLRSPELLLGSRRVIMTRRVKNKTKKFAFFPTSRFGYFDVAGSATTLGKLIYKEIG